jgi:hypothetical protein
MAVSSRILGTAFWNGGDGLGYALTLKGDCQGHLLLEVDDGIKVIETINLYQNKELLCIWDWVQMEFNDVALDEFMTAAVEAYALDEVA